MREPARGYSWPAATEGNQLARKHGFFAADVEDVAAEIVSDLFDEDTIARYPVMTLLYAETFVQWQRARADIAKRSLTVGDGDAEKQHPLLGHLTRCKGILMELSNRFGLDPKAEWLLQRDKAEGVRSLVDLEAVRSAGRAARERASVTAEAAETTNPPTDGRIQ